MTLEDFKAVRDVDVASNSAQFTEIKADLNHAYLNYLINNKSSLFRRKTTGTSVIQKIVFPDSTTRILTYPPLPVGDVNHYDSINVEVQEGYKYIVYQIADGDWLDGHASYSWSTDNETVAISSLTDHIVLAIAKTDNSEILIDDYDKVAFTRDDVKTAIEKNSVTYSTEQNLTDIQKQQAIKNIGVDSLINGISSNLGNLTDKFHEAIGTFSNYTLNKEIHHGWMSSEDVANLMMYPEANHIVISVKSGMPLSITANSNTTTPYAFLKSYTPPTNNGDAYDLCSGYTRTVIPSRQTVNLTVPSDCNYLFIGMHADSIAVHTPQSVKINDTEITLEEGSQTLPVRFEQKGFIPTDIDDIKSNIQLLQDEIFKQSPDSKSSLYIGKLVQNDVSASGIGSSSSVKVSQYSALAVPYYGVEVAIKCPEEYCVGFLSGETTTGLYISLNKDSGWLHDGDTYTFTSANQINRTYFGKNNGAGVLTVDEVVSLLNNREITITYINDSGNVIDRNFCNEEYVKNIMRGFSSSVVKNKSINRMPIFTHTSDVHGDVTRLLNFIEYSDYLDVDASLVSGDIVPMSSKDNASYFDEGIDLAKKPVLPCVGNHDARGLSTKAAQNVIVSHAIDKYSLATPETEDYPTYFYYDTPAKSIRLFSLNMYEAGQKDTNSWRWTQSQLDWFVSNLVSTPNGYGIIVMMHAPEKTINQVTGKEDFYQNGNVTTYGNFDPITKIIDAFIGRTTLSYSFTQETSGSSETITVTGDFTSVATGTEFICYVTGHRHYDAIGYVHDTTHTQLQCNVPSCFALYGTSSYDYYAELSDCVRGGKGMSQDAFNLYCIDRDTKTLRVARIGSNMTGSMTDRKFIIIPYAN
jgi:hypothetical protein